MNFFEHADRYPNAPGWKAEGTSREAADALAKTGKCEALRKRIIELIDERGPLTFKELERITGQHRDLIKPRLSEMVSDGVLVKSDQRRERCAAYARAA